MALWCFEGFSCRITSWLHYCLELWRDWNIYVTLTYPTIVWWLSMNIVLTVWKASGPSTWHGISWKPFHLEFFKISAVWNNLTCRATNWENFQNVFFVISVVLKNLTWAIILWICFPRDSLRASGLFVKSTWAKTAWVSLRMSSLANFSVKHLKTSHAFGAVSARRIWCQKTVVHELAWL